MAAAGIQTKKQSVGGVEFTVYKRHGEPKSEPWKILGSGGKATIDVKTEAAAKRLKSSIGKSRGGKAGSEGGKSKAAPAKPASSAKSSMKSLGRNSDGTAIPSAKAAASAKRIVSRHSKEVASARQRGQEVPVTKEVSRAREVMAAAKKAKPAAGNLRGRGKDRGERRRTAATKAFLDGLTGGAFSRASKR
jgi:hypothetical protein